MMKHYTFNLDTKDIEIIDAVAAKMTNPKRSEALRKIVRDWDYLTEIERRREEAAKRFVEQYKNE